MVQTLVSPMSTSHRAPETDPPSLVEPRRLDTEPAELGRRRFLGTGFVIPPALEEDLFGGFLTRPPSLEANSDEAVDGDAGALPEEFGPK